VGALTVAAYVTDGLVNAGDDYVDQLADVADRLRHADLLVAVDDSGRVVGTVTFCRPGSPYAEISRAGEAEFRMLAVDPAARGQGVGEALVHACLDRAGAAGDHWLVLSTLDRMSAARRLYARLGFEPDSSRDWSPVDGIVLRAYRRRVSRT
jgi:GNAT superfamily N-acetyltransferase